jgi:transcriptional regulator with XRE-family HTH domain
VTTFRQSTDRLGTSAPTTENPDPRGGKSGSRPAFKGGSPAPEMPPVVRVTRAGRTQPPVPKHPALHRLPAFRVSKLAPDELALTARLRQACAGHSCRALAKAAGVSHESIRRYQHGDSPPPAIVVARLCRHLNVSAEWVLYGDEKNSKHVQR